MKSARGFFVVFGVLTAACSGYSSAAFVDLAVAGDGSAALPLEPLASPQPPADLIGEWQLTMKISDTNRNGKIDDDERRSAITQARDYLKFNRDGTCVFYAHKVKGRYELKPQSSGSQVLYLFDQDNNREGRGVIVSVNRNELVLLSSSVGRIFSVYKRL